MDLSWKVEFAGLSQMLLHCVIGLKEKNYESGSPEAFSEWLERYFDEGNEISVHGEQYDFWSCLELV